MGDDHGQWTATIPPTTMKVFVDDGANPPRGAGGDPLEMTIDNADRDWGQTTTTGHDDGATKGQGDGNY